MAESPPEEPPSPSELNPGELSTYFDDLFAWMREKVGVDMNEALKGSDWMLVVMLHAMVETALNRAIVLELREPRLEKVISKLDTSDGSRGKVAFAKATDILAKPSIDFLQALSTLRNACVHNIRNFKIDLVLFLAGHEKASELRGAMRKGMDFNNPTRNETVQSALHALANDDPRLALFAGTFNIMMQLHLHNERCLRRDAEEELLRTKAARLDKIEPRQSTPTE